MPINEPDQDNLVETLDETDQAETTSSVETPTPGAVLQAERLRLNLSESQVSEQLHITMHYVRAIENNRFDKLPGAVFAKGYIKNYALYLGLDADAVTALFDGINSQQQEKKDETTRQQIARRRSDRNKPWVYASVACFVLGFAGLWAINSFTSEDNVPPTSAANQSAPGTASSATIASRPIAQTPAVSQPASVSNVPQSQPGALATTSASAPGVAREATSGTGSPVASGTNLGTALSALAAQRTAGTAGTADVEQSAATSAPPITQPSTQATEQLTTQSTTPPARQAATVPPADAPLDESTTAANSEKVITIAAEGDDVLRINFSGESWVEVNDSHANQIYRDIREAGDILEITGDAPFNILLGDAPFTRMYLNGTEIDVSDDIRIDNSARLTVGL